MPYDDDLFDEDFDFGDDEEAAEKSRDQDAEDEPKPAPKRRGRPPAKSKEKPAAERPPRSRARTSAAARRPEPPPPEDEPPPEPEPAAVVDEEPAFDEPVEEAAPVDAGPPADHAVHIYEYGTLKRTIPRKFTDEEAVSFAEEYTRTGKAYGRYAVATPDDEEPAPTFAGALRGN